MSTIYGLLKLTDLDATVDQVGQTDTYEAIAELQARHNADMEDVTRLFVETTTTDWQETYFLPGGGMMQEADRLTRPGAIKGVGKYSVGYDLRDARDQIGGDDITYAYMTIQKLDATIRNVFIRHANWVRFHILRHMFNSTNATFLDEEHGSITVTRLANGDGTLYPPVVGSDSEADQNHYLASGYAATAISDANNPFPVIYRKLNGYTGAANVVAFIHSDQQALTEALTDFVPAARTGVQESGIVALATGAPANVPGQFIGRVGNVAIQVWDWVPSGYIAALDTLRPAPLKKRIDRPAGIIGRGQLALVAQQEEFPLRESFWRDRHGYGVGNRLGAVIMELTINASYSDPALYA